MKDSSSRKRIRQFEEVALFMESNLEKWNSIDEIRRTYDEFRFNLKKIKDLQPELEQDLEPVKEEVRNKREQVLKKVFPIANILEVYAQDHKLGGKALKITKQGGQAGRLSDRELFRCCSRMYKLIDKYLHRTEVLDTDKGLISPGQDIKRYGLTQKMMDELNSSTHQFDSALHLHKDVSIYQSKVRSERDALIKTNRKLLKNRLNKLMSVFSGTHPSFYQKYQEMVSGT